MEKLSQYLISLAAAKTQKGLLYRYVSIAIYHYLSSSITLLKTQTQLESFKVTKWRKVLLECGVKYTHLSILYIRVRTLQRFCGEYLSVFFTEKKIG